MNLKKLYIFILLLITISTLKSQCKIDNYVFKANEELTYNVYYNWGFVWISAGNVKFNVKDTTIQNKDYWIFMSTGESYQSYDWIFKVSDKYQSITSKDNLEPIYYKRETSEGGYNVNNKYIFNKNKDSIYTFTQNSKKELTKDTLKYQNCLFDVLSATYYTRCLDFNKIENQDSLPIKTIIDNEIITIKIKYHGKEIIEDKSEHKYNTIKFSTTVVEGSVFKGDEEIFVWVSDDENKIPILIEAKILVGSVKVYLSEKQNIKYKFDAQID
jgi:hypothetical protein